MSARFVITVDAVAAVPVGAARLLQSTMAKKYLQTALTPNAPNAMAPNGAVLRVPDDGVLLMMGITDDLLDECEATYQRDYTTIAPEARRGKLLCWYARVKTGLTRTETLIAIATRKYWEDVDVLRPQDRSDEPANDWENLGKGDRFELMDSGDIGPRNTRTTLSELPPMIRACQGQKGWVKL